MFGFYNITHERVKLFENLTSFIEMLYIVENATQTISKLGNLDKQTKNVFKQNYI